MKLLADGTMIRIGDKTVDKSSGKVIECNVNMRVSLKSRSKIFQRIQSFFVLLLALSMIMCIFHMQREVRHLQMQVHSMSLNVAILTWKYERLSKSMLRASVLHYRDHTSTQDVVTESNDLLIESDNSSTPAAIDPTLKSRAIRSIAASNVTLIEGTGHSRVARARRTDEGRGKQRRKLSKRKFKRRRRLEPLVATFVGAIPEQHITNTVFVGPWVKRNESRYGFSKFHLVEDRHSIEVSANGLYMISAQIYYFGEPTHYSYWILLTSEGSSFTRKVIKCATASSATATEASCYTSVILPLRRGDRLHIEQQELNRLINLREGHSYLQVMLLSGDPWKNVADID